MNPPFTTDQFLEVFARYNGAVWPAHGLFYLLAALVLWLAWRPRPRAGVIIAGVLAFFWAWMGVAYHWTFFRAINPAAAGFAALFVLQAALFVHAGMNRPPRLTFRVRGGPASLAGWVLVAYALVAYPLLGLAVGQAYPRMPTFGLPCPTVIFTFGVLLWADRPPLRLLLVPGAWSVLGAFAAAQHGIVQDYGLPAAALAGTALILWRRRRTRGAPGPGSALAHAG